MNLSRTRSELTELFEKYAQSEAFFYVTLDPERALGLEDILPNYTIICPYSSKLTDELKRGGVRVVVLEEELGAKEVEGIVQKGSYGMLQSELVRGCINNNVGDRNPHILILKNSALIEELCKKNKWNLMAPKAKIAEKFENKISQYKLLKNIVPYPPSSIGNLGDYYLGTSAGERAWSPTLVGGASRGQNESPRWGDECVLNSNHPGSFSFVLQFNRGHSGNSTFFINSKRDLTKLYKLYPKREAKISEYINGKTYTLNCLVLGGGETITGSLSEQITGLKEATNNPNTTVGNDFTSPRKFAKKSAGVIEEMAQNVGKFLYTKGYKGLFGIDVIISLCGTDADKVYFIEINTHQPASISFEARLHRKIGRTPLLAYFILDNIGTQKKSAKKIRLRRSGRMTEPPIILPISAKQIIYRNKTNKTLKAEDIKNKCGRKYFISRMRFIKPNEEIYRTQVIK